MIKSVLQSISGIEIYPIISLFLFLVVFVIMIIRVIRMDSSEIRDCSRLPLDDDRFVGTISEDKGK